MPKYKPSLYRADYYTLEEYRLLVTLLNGNLLGLTIANCFDNIKKIKRAVQCKFYLTTQGMLTNILTANELIYNTPLSGLLIYINSSNSAVVAICQWRFQINK